MADLGKVAARVAILLESEPLTPEQAEAAIKHFKVWSANEPEKWEDEIPHFAKYHAREENLDPIAVERALRESLK